ncbi:MAG: DNA gyrase subunit A [Candidatus Omnitrophota bacterium]
MYTQGEKIVPVYLEAEMKDSYINYAMSVIVGRALPDVRDGLKPVHRRILYAMNELSLQHNKPYKKSARIVGDTLGRYHPHGDVAVYDTLVRMVQDFSMRYPLVDGQGNFGSIDGDAPAAMRYTEARLSEIASEILVDIDEETVDFVPNFDGSMKEPVIMPTKLPTLLINGSSGIAVGMATNIPPHNLNEIADAAIMMIETPDVTIKQLMRAVKGPDFPTGGIIYGMDGVREAYQTGRGLLKVQAKANVESQKSGKEFIIITEIPYQVNKASLLETIANLVNAKKIDGITDLRDESDKDGMRMVIELRRDANAQIVLNQLYKHTQLSTTFGVIMLALVDGSPRVLNLKQLIEKHIEHRKDIIIRRTKFELKKAQERAHILEGLKIALANLDKIIKLIKSSKNPAAAKEALMDEFDLTGVQAQAILDMQLSKLTSLEREKLEEEYIGLLKKIEIFKAILASEKKVLDLIKEELQALKKKYGDERRTEIIAEATDFEIEDLIAEEDVVITISHSGYIKRLPISGYRKQRRGGVGVTAVDMKEEDFAEHLFIASTHDYILFFTDKGRVYWLKVFEIPQAGRTAKGKAIVNLIQLQSQEQVRALVAAREFKEGEYLVMATKLGLIKKTGLASYGNPRKGGIIAITLEKDDELIGVGRTDGEKELLLATKEGKSVRFPEKQVRDMGRGAKGVRGIRLGKKDEVVGMEIVKEDETILTFTEGGFGKRSKLSEYRKQSRGGKGIINIKVTKKNGTVVGIKTVSDKDEIMIITQTGMIVRTPVKDIRTIGRSTQGVRVISIKEKDRVASIATVVPEDQE